MYQSHMTLFDKIRKLTGQIIQYDTVSNIRVVSNLNRIIYEKGLALVYLK